MRVLFAAAALLALVPWSGPAEAAGRRPYGGTLRVAGHALEGWRDAHVARGVETRALASWVHCGLLRTDERGRVRPDLALGPGRAEDGALVLEVTPDATFHDGTSVTADDVVASLERLVRVRRRDSLGRLLGTVDARALDLGTVALRPPQGADLDVLRRLLARPEVAVLKHGTSGRGHACGAFRLAGRSAAAMTLEAHRGHPRGRPWLDEVRVVRVDGPRDEAAALRFGEVDVARRRSPRHEASRSVGASRHETLFAVPHPRWRGGGGLDLRRAVVALAARARLARYLDWPARAARSPWPPELAPTDAVVPEPAGRPRVEGMVIAYPAERSDLAEVARALRDALRPLSDGPARAIPVAAGSLAEARAAEKPDWDLALVSHAWSALDGVQAASELAAALGVEGPSPRSALAGRVADQAERVVRRVEAIPVLHLAPTVYHRPGWRVSVDGAGLTAAGDSWRAR
ncbi:MAG: ABC transporter substrate-binding protein [Myxococcota bacterium]